MTADGLEGRAGQEQVPQRAPVPDEEVLHQVSGFRFRVSGFRFQEYYLTQRCKGAKNKKRAGILTAPFGLLLGVLTKRTNSTPVHYSLKPET
jgi:hypothetical protein